MPYTVSAGARIYYEVEGDGPPVLLIEGLGYSLWVWDLLRPELARHFRVIAFDNRGVGRSDVPEGPYTTAQMADDAAAVLDAAGVEKAHVIGASMGGMIAQELALRHPDRVDRLVLACTHPGGPEHTPAPAETVQTLLADPSGLTPEQVLRRNMALAFAPGWVEAHPDAFDRWIRRRLDEPVDPRGWAAQLQAVAAHDTWDRVDRIRRPVLVISGDQDRVVPAANSRLLAERLPDARLEIVPGGGHLFFLEQPERFHRRVIRFLNTGR